MFVLTPIYVVASEEDPDFVVEDVESRLRPHPTLPVVLALCRMLSLALYSELEPDPDLFLLWSIIVAFLLVAIVCIKNLPL